MSSLSQGVCGEKQLDQTSQGTQVSATWLRQCFGLWPEVASGFLNTCEGRGAQNPPWILQVQEVLKKKKFSCQVGALWRVVCEPGQMGREGSVLSGWRTDHCSDRTCADTTGGHKCRLPGRLGRNKSDKDLGDYA